MHIVKWMFSMLARKKLDEEFGELRDSFRLKHKIPPSSHIWRSRYNTVAVDFELVYEE